MCHSKTSGKRSSHSRSIMNRRMRNRTSDGVGGGEGNPASSPIAFRLLECEVANPV